MSEFDKNANSVPYMLCSKETFDYLTSNPRFLSLYSKYKSEQGVNVQQNDDNVSLNVFKHDEVDYVEIIVKDKT